MSPQQIKFQANSLLIHQPTHVITLYGEYCVIFTDNELPGTF